MKSPLLAFLFASTAIFAAADQPSLAGKWQIHISIMGYEGDLACTFAQKDADLAGSCTSDQGTSNLSGKVEDQKITWVYKSEYNGGPITLTYHGSLQNNKLSGSVSVEEYNVEGEFTGTQAK